MLLLSPVNFAVFPAHWLNCFRAVVRTGEGAKTEKKKTYFFLSSNIETRTFLTKLIYMDLSNLIAWAPMVARSRMKSSI